MSASITTLERTRAYWQLLQNSGFRLLFLGQAISQFGDWMNRVALLVLAYRIAGPGFAVGLILLAQLLPRVIISPFGGLLADRYPKRQLMIILDLIRALLAGSMAFADATNALILAGGLVIMLHSLSAVFNPARKAILPAIVPSSSLPFANALNDMTGQAAFFLGPAFGGWVATTWGISAVFLTNALSFILSAICIAFIQVDEPPYVPTAHKAILQPLLEGWRTMTNQSLLRIALGGLVIEAIIAVGVTVILLPLLTGPLQTEAESLGLLLTGVGLGTIVGAPLGLWLFGRYRTLALITTTTLGLILSLVILGVAPTFAIALIALICNGVFTGITDLIVVTTVQQQVSTAQLGRAFGLMFWILALGQLVGALGGSLLLRYIAARESLLALALGCAIFVMALLFTTLRNKRTIPTP